MTYPYQSDIQINQVTLNVENLKEMTSFYSDIFGFSILSATDTTMDLTTNGKDSILQLVEVKKGDHFSYGLYHTAFLVPDKDSFAQVLYHLVYQHAELIGGADHGYSQAIYLNDPEGNGIEIYHDKDMSVWDIREDGRIIGVTEELDAQSLIDSVSSIEEPYQLPKGTRIGHVHFSVRDAIASSQLYQKIFPITNKMTVPTASWVASGEYHHHFAFNHWAGKGLNKHNEGMPGLALVSLEYKDAVIFKASEKKLDFMDLTFLKLETIIL
ncbi:hypothetical protein HMPREF9318_00945 [Streptococcus urinalis FB127-CNA-2]|uniref:Glyoxalase family protein n=1 Tax=Streptococcus urinalis 2285-97 TaxID=764291 RepID=G5KGS9_9STRE|nr:glyoxalase family protein [Streptococcus urinalis 2285-97]EKS20991.1 hypothetical protein HMPREF9318_00945 [Streptococcus urinalis FB127-CNA-2]VEF31000.1 glyoxalase/bleomycin resistance protein/dioxygenase superfamily protein [Streptococcus urinalis]